MNAKDNNLPYANIVTHSHATLLCILVLLPQNVSSLDSLRTADPHLGAFYVDTRSSSVSPRANILRYNKKISELFNDAVLFPVHI